MAAVVPQAALAPLWPTLAPPLAPSITAASYGSGYEQMCASLYAQTLPSMAPHQTLVGRVVGPAAFPGNLARAVQHAVHWPEGARDAAERHGAFVRFRLSYALGKGPDAPVYPEGADPIHELVLLALLGQATLDLPGALAFFQPGAELLLSQRDVRERLGRARKQELPPVDVFAHARFVHVSDAPGWSLMDTVGLDALFLPDQEACFRPEAISPDAVHGFLLDLACYLVQEGEVVKPGDTVEGPGGVWRCHAAPENALRPAPRRTLRWFPEGEDVPAVFRVE